MLEESIAPNLVLNVIIGFMVIPQSGTIGKKRLRLSRSAAWAGFIYSQGKKATCRKCKIFYRDVWTITLMSVLFEWLNGWLLVVGQNTVTSGGETVCTHSYDPLHIEKPVEAR